MLIGFSYVAKWLSGIWLSHLYTTCRVIFQGGKMKFLEYVGPILNFLENNSNLVVYLVAMAVVSLALYVILMIVKNKKT